MAEDLHWAFSRGDVICAINKNVRWVVVKTASGNFIDGTKWGAYSVQQLEDGVLTTGEGFVKVGRWRSKTLPSGTRTFDVELDVPLAKPH